MAFPIGWGRKQKITIQASQVSGSGAHTDFPVLITLDHLNSEIVDAGSNSALNGGGDIRFSQDADGQSALACEVVEFVTDASAVNRKCVIWVKVPSLSTSSNTDIYIWYKKAATVQPATDAINGSRNVWDSNYVLVAHDCATNSIDGTALTLTGSVTSNISDPIGGNQAVDFGFHNQSNFYDMSITPIDEWTMQQWGYSANSVTDNEAHSVIMRNAAITAVCGLAQRDDGRWNFWSEAEGWADADPGWATADTWAKQDLKISGAGGTLKNIRGGVLRNTETNFNDDADKNILSIGAIDIQAGAFNVAWEGYLCEIRLSDIERSDDWCFTEWNNQDNPAGFAVADTPISVNGVNIASSDHSHLSGDITLEGTFPFIEIDESYSFDSLTDGEANWIFTAPAGNGLQSQDTRRQWCWDNNETSSSGVGPQFGQGGNPDGYVYTEMSSPGANGDEFILEVDNDFDVSGQDVVFSYYYCYRGDGNNGTIQLQTNENGAGWVDRGTAATIDSEGTARNSSAVWIEKTVDLAALISHVATRFRLKLIQGSNGTAWHKDVGIDSVTIQGTVSAEASLTLQEAAHAQFLDNVTVTQAHDLNIQNSTNGHSLENLLLIQESTLVIQGALHGFDSDNPAVTQQNSIAIQDTLHGFVSDSADLTQDYVVQAMKGNHGHSADDMALAQIHQIIIDEAGHNQNTDGIILAEGSGLNLGHGLHGFSNDDIILSEAGSISISIAAHGQFVDEVAVQQIHILSLVESQHLFSSDHITTETQTPFLVQSSIHTLLGQGLSLGYSVNLLMENARHAGFAEHAAVTQNHVMVISDAGQIQSTDEIFLKKPVAGDESNHGHQSGHADILQDHRISGLFIRHNQQADDAFVRIPPGIWGQIGEFLTNWQQKSEPSDQWITEAQGDNQWTTGGQSGDPWVKEDKNSNDWQDG